MPKPHKDLPGGSQAWAAEVDAVIAENKQLHEVVRRLAANAGIDFANPKRGINTGNTPSVKNPVGQKISSLADVSTYDVLDGQVLTWSKKKQQWIPTTPGGTVAPSVVPADTWSPPIIHLNNCTNPSFENNLDGWVRGVANSWNAAHIASVDIAHEIGAGIDGGNAMRATATGAVYGHDPQYMPFWGVMIPVPLGTVYGEANIKHSDDHGTSHHVGFIFQTPAGMETRAGYWSSYDPTDEWFDASTTMQYTTVPDGATAQWLYVGATCYGSEAGQPPYTASMLIDNVITTTAEYENYFTGDTTDDYHTVYEWDGTPGNSSSTGTELQRVFAPSVFPENSVIEVQGEHFLPNNNVFIQLSAPGFYNNVTKLLQTDASGNFATTLDVGYLNAPASPVFIKVVGDDYTTAELITSATL